MCADTRLRQFSTYVEETCGVASQEDASRPYTQSKIKMEHTGNKLFTSTVQLMLGDMDWMEVNPFQGKRKIDGRVGRSRLQR